MRSERDSKYINAQEHKLYLILLCIISLEGTEKIKTNKKKKTAKQSEEYFFYF